MTRLAFRADVRRREIAGMILPWNRVAASGGKRWRFRRGSVSWPDEPGRVKLLLGHDLNRPIGFALWLEDRGDGIHGAFRVARGEDGDRALSLAADGVLDGLSAGPDIRRSRPDPDDLSAELVHEATLVEVSLTPVPAYGDARVARVNASHGVAPRGLGDWRALSRSRSETVLTGGEPDSTGFQLGTKERGFYG